MGRKKKNELAVSVVNPLNLNDRSDEEDEDEETADAEYGQQSTSPRIGANVTGGNASDKMCGIPRQWTVPVVATLTAIGIILAVAAVLEEVGEPTDTWSTDVPVGRLYDG